MIKKDPVLVSQTWACDLPVKYKRRWLQQLLTPVRVMDTAGRGTKATWIIGVKVFNCGKMLVMQKEILVLYLVRVTQQTCIEQQQAAWSSSLSLSVINLISLLRLFFSGVKENLEKGSVICNWRKLEFYCHINYLCTIFWAMKYP